MALKGKPIAIGTSDTTIYTCPSTIEASVHGLVFANNTGSAVTITLKVYIQSLGTTTTVATGISVSANSTYTWPKPIDVNAGDYIQASASTGSAIVCLYSTYEGSATPAEVGFTPEGTWSSGSTYQTNDVVSYNGSSYLAIQASTNQNPASATSYWMVLAAKGDTGTGDVTTNTAQTITGTKSFTGTSSTPAMVLTDAAEVVTISATAATGTINYDVTTQSVLYYTTNASANFTMNFRGSSGTSLNTLLSTGQSITVTFLNTNGSTAYYNNAVTVDGSAVTPKYQGGTAWSAGNASSIDAYTYTILKTGNAAFTVFAAQTKFA
jgi:hypothetical protein